MTEEPHAGVMKLPAGWETVELGDLGTWVGGATPSKAAPALWEPGEVPWLSPKDMGGDVITSTRDKISLQALEATPVRLVPPGSVALVVRSGILERTVPVGLISFETTLNQDMKAIVPFDGVEGRWIAWGLRANERELLRHCRKAGTTVASLNTQHLLRFQLPLPPLAEQRRILTLLEDYLSRLDAATRLTDAVCRRADELLTRYVDHTVGRLSESCALGALLRQPLINGRSVPTEVGGFPVLRLTAITDGRLALSKRKGGRWTREEASRYLVEKGDFFRLSVHRCGWDGVIDRLGWL